MRFLAVLFVVASAHADVRGVVRVGTMHLDLQASRDTMVFGDEMGRVVDAYNLAADLYSAQTGQAVRHIDVHELGIDDRLVTLAPGVEVGKTLFVRMEGMFALGSELRIFGLGLYPLNVQFRVPHATVIYLSAGMTAGWLDRDSNGVGMLASARVACGLRIHEHFLVEAGYSAFVLGGVLDTPRLDRLGPDAPLPWPHDMIAAGEARNVVDLSIGFAF